MNDSVREKLQEIIRQYSNSLCDEPKRCEALLRDFCAKDRREIFILIAALKEGVASDLLNSSNSISQQLVSAKLVKRLQDNLGITEESAIWAVDSWALALGISSQLNQKNDKQQPETKKHGTQNSQENKQKNEPKLPISLPLPSVSKVSSTSSLSSHSISTTKPKNKFKFKKLWSAMGMILLGLLGTQIYGYLQDNSFPYNPISLLDSSSNSKFLKYSFIGHTDYVSNLAINPNNQTLVTAGEDKDQSKNIKVWNLNTGDLKYTLSGSEKFVITPDSQTLVSLDSNNDKTIKVWNLNTGNLKYTLSGHGKFAITPDSQTLVSFGSNSDETIKVWNLNTGNLKYTFSATLSGHGKFAITPDSETLVSLDSNDDKTTIKVWNLNTENLKYTLSEHNNHSNDARYLINRHYLVISHDGQTFVSTSDPKFLHKTSKEQNIKIWNLKTGDLKHIITVSERLIQLIAISRDGQTLVISSPFHTRFFDLKTGKEKFPPLSSSSFVAINSKGKDTLLIRDEDAIQVYDLKIGNVKHTLTGRMESFAISNDGETLVVSGDNNNRAIKIWDLETGELKHTLNGHTRTISDLAISSDGKTIVSSSEDNTIKVWQMP